MRHHVAGVFLFAALAAGCTCDRIAEPPDDAEYLYKDVYRDPKTGYLVDADTGRVSLGEDKPFTAARGSLKRLADAAVSNGGLLQDLAAEIELLADRVDVFAQAAAREGREANRADRSKEAQTLDGLAETQRATANYVVWVGISCAWVGEESRDKEQLLKASGGSKKAVSRVRKYVQKLVHDVKALEAKYPGVRVPKVVLCDAEGFVGRAYGLAEDAPQLAREARWSTRSLQVMYDGWVIFYSKPDFRGSELYVRGPCSFRSLRELARISKQGNEGSWHDAIASVRFSATTPQGDGTFVGTP